MIKKVIVLLIVVGLAAYLYTTLNPSKNKMVTYLVSKGFASDLSGLLKLGDDYIKAWYKAAKDGYAQFTLGNKTYKTNGGLAV